MPAAQHRARGCAADGSAAAVAVLFGPVGMPVVALVGCAALAVRRGAITPVALTVAAGAGWLLTTIAGEDVVDRVRPALVDAVPPSEHSPSFPGGHTLHAVVICGVLASLLVLRRRRTSARVALVVAALAVVIAVGRTRVLLGAHRLTDVLAGRLLGAAWLAVVITAHRLFLTARAPHPSVSPEERRRP